MSLVQIKRGGHESRAHDAHTLDPRTAPPFPAAAKIDLRDTQLRRNVARATDTIQRKRAALVEEKTDWQALRDAGAAIRRDALTNLDRYLLEFEERFQAAGGTVHWAANAAEANRIVLGILREHEAREVIKIKSMTTAEIGLNDGVMIPANAAALVGAGVLSVLVFPSIAAALARRDRPVPGIPEAMIDPVVVTEARVVGEVSAEGDAPLPAGDPAADPAGDPAEPERSAE